MNALGIKKIVRSISQLNLEALLITNQVNVRYLSGFRGEGQLLITSNKKILCTDFRFEEEAARDASSFRICVRESFRPQEESIFNLIKELKLKRLGFEANSLSYGFYRKLKGTLGPVKLIPAEEIVEQLRAIKSPEEVKLLKKAASLALKSYHFAKEIIKPHRREIEIAREVQYFMRKNGAEDSAFEIIIASGKRSSLPHGPSSHKAIKENEAVLVDLGCRLSSYNSDLTRMVFLGKIKTKIKQIDKIVRKAQQQAIKAVRAGEKISQVDQIARQTIAKEGLGAFFGHALGHGIGREVHEYPSISSQNQDILKEGMVFTVEPAVYIPGLGGVRVEDMVLVTKTGCEVLTK